MAHTFNTTGLNADYYYPDNRRPLANRPIHGNYGAHHMNHHLPPHGPPQHGWAKPPMARQPPVRQPHMLVQQPHGSYNMAAKENTMRYGQVMTPKIQERNRDQRASAAPFQSPTTLSFERMLSAGKSSSRLTNVKHSINNRSFISFFVHHSRPSENPSG
jgi:hypothetical protein